MEKHECDLAVLKKKTVVFHVQVCHQLTTHNLDREIDGLREAMAYFEINMGYIITANEEDQFSVGEGLITIQPAWKWLSLIDKF